MKWFIFLFLASGALYACSKTELSRGPRPLVPKVPANFPGWVDMPDNPLTYEGVALGRRLFYDKRLSGLNNISCASCHNQQLAFTDGVALSNIGTSGTTLHRNAPPLFNLAWANNGLFWDGGSTNLESQAFAPLASEDEMHQNLFELVEELRADPDYRQLFRFVYQDEEITTGNIVKSLAQFQRTLISADSRYDKFIRNEPEGWLSEEEKKGMQLVQTHCAGCHQGELFTDNQYHNNGLDADFSNESSERIFMGRYRVTNNISDLGKFRTPSLRNIFLTAPYMHDGRFQTIIQVLDHYTNGVKISATLDARLKKTDGQPGLSLSTAEKQAIITYLGTLTDSSFINNKIFSQP